MSKKMFFRVWAEKGIMWHIDVSSIVYTTNCKLANQIESSVAIAVKKKLFHKLVLQ